MRMPSDRAVWSFVGCLALAFSACSSSDNSAGSANSLAADAGSPGASGSSGSPASGSLADAGHTGRADASSFHGGDAAHVADPTSGGAPSDGSATTQPAGAASMPGASGLPIPTSPACPTPTGAPVTLSQTGSSFVLANGLLTATLNQSGQLTQLAKSGKNLMRSGDTLYVSESGGSSYYSIGASSHTVVSQTADLVELSFVDTSVGKHDMDWDIHYVMRRGVSGLYYFLIAKTGTSTHPNSATLSELRTVQRFDPAVLSNGYSGERHGALPTVAQNATFSDSTQLQDATYPITVAPMSLAGVSSLPGVTGQHYAEGPVFSKYDWASYRTDDLVHGLYGNGFGAWLVSPSWEFYTGGPVKQELMVHHENLILNMYHGGHFGSATTSASPAKWQKLYGPNLIYVNTGADDALIADALTQGATERGQWPYCWMKNELFPLAAERSTVTGQLSEAHGQSVEGAMVVLAAPGPLLNQGYDYMFWAQADAQGNFTIPAVRSGSYAVHVYATRGTIIDDPDHGEILKTVAVGAGATELGALSWTPPYHARPVFALGTSDRRSGEFRFDPHTPPGADNIAAHTGRMYGPDAMHGVWTVPPANVRYQVGTSTAQTDWYFVQSVDGTWTIDFSLADVPNDGAFLTLGLAGAARSAHLRVAINGHPLIDQAFGNDQSLYRSALQGGSFSMLTAAVPASNLSAGSNQLTFDMNTQGSAGAGVYYDVIKLESD